MRIALIGYGKMGKLIETLAKTRGHSISFCISSKNTHLIKQINLENTDVAIEFTTPSAVKDNLYQLLNNSVPVVVGTTGWEDSMEDIVSCCLSNSTAMLYASNFSLGANILFEVNSYLAKIIKHYTDSYTVEIEEIHHPQKLDAPSGTAITLAQEIIKHLPNLEDWQLSPKDIPNRLLIKAVREDNVTGIHNVDYNSDEDQISISHKAKNRNGFVLGALIGAEFLKGKQGVFTMRDVVKLL